MNTRFLGATKILARWSDVSPQRRDGLFVIALALVCFLALTPGLSGEGTSIPHMQLIGLMAALMASGSPTRHRTRRRCRAETPARR